MPKKGPLYYIESHWEVKICHCILLASDQICHLEEGLRSIGQWQVDKFLVSSISELYLKFAL